jgi:hypothetical protein
VLQLVPGRSGHSLTREVGAHYTPSPSAKRALGAIAQLEERLDRTQEVAGSSPASSIRSSCKSACLQEDLLDRCRPGRR